jgi:putative hydrolase of the HAD superfamily
LWFTRVKARESLSLFQYIFALLPGSEKSIMKTVIFDLGRVLIDYDGQATLQAVQALTKLSFAELRAVSKAIEDPFGLGQIDGQAFYALLQDKGGVTAPYAAVVAAFCSQQARNERGLAYATACQLRPDVQVGIVSNTNILHAQWLFAHVPEFDHFPAVLLSHEVGLLKPDKAIYNLALDQLGVAAEKAFFIDDLPANLKGARQVGMAVHLHRDWAETEAAVAAWLAASHT